MSKDVPFNPDAERAVISLLYQEPDMLGILPWRKNLFFDYACQTLFEELEEILKAGDPRDLCSITIRLAGSGKLEKMGGGENLNRILSTLGPVFSSLPYYFDCLVDARAYRNVISELRSCEPDLANMSLRLEAFLERVTKAADRPVRQKEQTTSDQIDELLAELESQEPEECFPFGLPEIDEKIGGGLHRGELSVVGGETSGGKSVLLGMAALEIAIRDKAVTIFSLEMPAKDVLRRIGSNIAGMRLKSFKEQPSEREMAAMSKAIHRMLKLKLTIKDRLCDIERIEAESRRLVNLGKADVIIVDYVQLVENIGQDNREQALSDITRRLKNLALTTKVAVFTASQVNDDGKLRESRAIGQHADCVLFIEGDFIKVGKNRRGPREISIPVNLRGDISRFEYDDSRAARTPRRNF